MNFGCYSRHPSVIAGSTRNPPPLSVITGIGKQNFLCHAILYFQTLFAKLPLTTNRGGIAGQARNDDAKLPLTTYRGAIAGQARNDDTKLPLTSYREGIAGQARNDDTRWLLHKL